MRQPQANDFFVDVEGVGKFRFAHRKMKDELQIQRKYAEIAGGVEPTVWLASLAEYLSTLNVLTVNGPEGWDLDNMDPLDNDTYAKINAVYKALREREETFRGRPAKPREDAGESDSPDSGLLVSAQVQTDDL
ncbi:hypothetical protein E0G74_00990 [Salmonella enterica]|nr:hypothetical protein [Salmonella enterica]